LIVAAIVLMIGDYIWGGANQLDRKNAADRVHHRKHRTRSREVPSSAPIGEAICLSANSN